MRYNKRWLLDDRKTVNEYWYWRDAENKKDPDRKGETVTVALSALPKQTQAKLIERKGKR